MTLQFDKPLDGRYRHLGLSEQETEVRTVPPLRWPTCQARFERFGLDMERVGTVCQGCRYDLSAGCPNIRAWSLDAQSGEIMPVCAPGDLFYCRHYDCGCDLCANFVSGTPLPLAARR
jgi:hypothetical protein